MPRRGVEHLTRQLGDAKVVVWEHSSHVGARATERSTVGELNVGQLARIRWPDSCLLVGSTTDDPARTSDRGHLPA